MEYEISIDHENKIVITTCHGILDADSAKVMVKDARKQACDWKYNLLYDMTDLTVAMSFAQVYAFPRQIPSDGFNPRPRSSRAAILALSGRDEDVWKFYENTARSAGSVVQIFDDRDQALNWLSQESPS